MATTATMGNITESIMQSTMVPATTMLATMEPIMQQHPKRQQQRFLKGQQWSTMQHTIPPHSTTPLNTTSPVLLLTGHHLVLFLQDGRPPKELPSVGSALCRYTNVRCPGGALFKGDPQGTTATPSWCQETRGLRERPGSRPRSLVGSQLPTYPRQCQ